MPDAQLPLRSTRTPLHALRQAPKDSALLRRWGDKEYPDSVVIGIGKNVFGVTSGLALGIGLYCVAQSNLLNILSGSTVNGFYVAGSLLVPYSWGLHVASWIHKQNGK